jgi:hypothetical protein
MPTVRCYDRIKYLASQEVSGVMPDPGSSPGQAFLIRHPVTAWILAFAGMTLIVMLLCSIA